MSSGHAHAPLGPARVEEVSDGVFAYIQPDGSWWINNMGFLAGRKHTIAVDTTSTVARTSAFQEAIARTANVPVTTLVNTHHHGDHTNGNFMLDGATIVAHEEARRLIVEDGEEGIKRLQNAGIFVNPDGGPDWGDIEPAPPFLTFRDGVDLYVDDLRCEVRHLGSPAHTTNDSIVWIPERRVLFSGDLLFNGGTPFLLMGSVVGAIEVVQSLKQFDAEVVVPGHGDVCTMSVVDDVLDYLHFVNDLAVRGHADGVPPLELARQTDLGRFAGLGDSERIVGNLHRAYAELDGGERGAEIDTLAAIGDMVQYNGGKPLTCLA
ncbi:MBL fold metallo-hydrolase [Cumulibacter manganitolerans]|uniref:MBL fold metallo-hydrolase n=1 Tax=Cumulibacter manganitolerans TaxID=1884992 RepID=UPI0012969270|nr:MBL fold metallo-hydrolase [Cumulibacter manganitolerans]